jgi:drug/metabolite transporter (DMT)-like permease
VLALGVLCTGIAYILYFRLLIRLGPARAVTVTYLVPLAAMVAGALVLDEKITPPMLLGCGLILLGTGLATGLVRPGRSA